MRILLTGAAAGLLQGIALALARDGHEIAFTYRNGGTPPDETLALLARENLRADAYAVDFFAEPPIIERSLAPAAAGAQALVHGVGPMSVARFERCEHRDYAEMIDGNLRSGVLAARAVLPQMRGAGFGRLIFFGMNGSSVTQPAAGLSLHVAAKSALVAFAKTLALEEARSGITVNVIEPGDIRAKQRTRAQAKTLQAGNPRGRPGTWEDLADAVRFLLNPEHDFVNGAVLAVTGGLTEPYERKPPTP